jgi:hypothetical protein
MGRYRRHDDAGVLPISGRSRSICTLEIGPFIGNTPSADIGPAFAMIQPMSVCYRRATGDYSSLPGELSTDVEGDGGGEIGFPVDVVKDTGHHVGQIATESVSSFVSGFVTSVCSCVSRWVRRRLVVKVDLSFFKNVKGTKKKYYVKIMCMNKIICMNKVMQIQAKRKELEINFTWITFLTNEMKIRVFI